MVRTILAFLTKWMIIFFPSTIVANQFKIGLIYPMEGPQSNMMCISEAIINDSDNKNIKI